MDLLRETGRACIAMEAGCQLRTAELACGHAAAFRSVIASGPVKILGTLEEKCRGLEKIMVHATGTGDWTFSEETLRKVCVCELTAEEISCKEHL